MSVNQNMKGIMGREVSAKQENIKEAKNRITETINNMNNITEEMAGKETMGKDRPVFSDQTNYINNANTPKTPANQQAMVDEALAAVVAMIDEDQDVKKKEKSKRKKLDEKLAEMAELEGQFAMEDLNPDEQGVVNEFFENLRKLKKLKKRYKEIEEKEQRFWKILKFNKDKQKDSKDG